MKFHPNNNSRLVLELELANRGLRPMTKTGNVNAISYLQEGVVLLQR